MAEHALVSYGRLVTFDEEQPVIEDGALYIGGDGRMGCRPGSATTPGRKAKPRHNNCADRPSSDMKNTLVWRAPKRVP